MANDQLADIQRDFLHGIATVVDAFNRLVELYLPESTVLRPVAMQVRAEVVPDAAGPAPAPGREE